MAEKKVLMITRVNAVWSSLEEFNEHWGTKNLPFWEEHGAKHLGSFANYLGAKKNQIVRLFEFENLSRYNEFMEFREKMFNSEKGKEGLRELYGFIEELDETAWVSVY